MNALIRKQLMTARQPIDLLTRETLQQIEKRMREEKKTRITQTITSLRAIHLN